jgi:hypothetical protein
MPGLIRGVARTAAVAGTATVVSNRVSRRQANRWADQAAAQAPPPQQADGDRTTLGTSVVGVAQSAGRHLLRLASLTEPWSLGPDPVPAVSQRTAVAASLTEEVSSSSTGSSAR